ncbi:hypothetical protein [Streptomyces roseifaciens]|uniref:hypothetical protein n=1 Tax=Streptomyces roseifaciens TaxID=1488406 RepID=UPI000717F405|nr:hypothetical protein [Streptomyces roseifaciens]
MRRPTAAVSALLAATALVSTAVPAAATPADERGTDRETARGAAAPAGEGKGTALQRALDGAK